MTNQSAQELMAGGDLKDLVTEAMTRPFNPPYSKVDALRWAMEVGAFRCTLQRPQLSSCFLRLFPAQAVGLLLVALLF
jgi:hypothetical protein